MASELSRMGRALMLGASLWGLSAIGAFAQDFSRLQCPTLTELRMEMLVRYGYCPRDRFYARMFREQVQDCDPTLSDLQVQDKILNDDSVPAQDKERYQKLLRFMQRNNCEI